MSKPFWTKSDVDYPSQWLGAASLGNTTGSYNQEIKKTTRKSVSLFWVTTYFWLKKGFPLAFLSLDKKHTGNPVPTLLRKERKRDKLWFSNRLSQTAVTQQIPSLSLPGDSGVLNLGSSTLGSMVFSINLKIGSNPLKFRRKTAEFLHRFCLEAKFHLT